MWREPAKITAYACKSKRVDAAENDRLQGPYSSSIVLHASNCVLNLFGYITSTFDFQFINDT
jgi:hypothetical protein